MAKPRGRGHPAGCKNLIARWTIPPSDGALPLQGQRAIVVGASGGLGAAIAAELSRSGADLLLLGRSLDALAAVRERVSRGDSDVHVGGLDVTRPESVRDAFTRGHELLGGLEILVYCAGAAESAPFARTDEGMWDRMLAVNATGAFRCLREAAPAMVRAGYGRIVNIASTAGLKAYPYTIAYTASKHALIGLTRALALELVRQGVTVNAVCPGFADTPMTERSIATIVERTGRSPEDARAELERQSPIGRLIRPAEVAATVGWLCLPTSSGITGQCIGVSGSDV